MLTICARFVSFLAGAMLAVLLVIGLWSEDVVVNAEVGDKSPLWWAGVLGSVLAGCRALIPGDYQVFSPQKDMDDVVTQTHYQPRKWRGRAHTIEVRDEFCGLFEYRVAVFMREVLSVLFAPFILMFSLPSSAENIADFFREFTVEVSGIGYVCSFAEFNLDKHGNEKYGAKLTTAKPLRTRQGKLEKSILHFKANHPDWRAPREGEEMFMNLSTFASSNSDSVLQNSNPTALSQSMSVLDPNSSALVSSPFGNMSVSLDPESLAVLQKVQQKFYEVKSRDMALSRSSTFV